ncbi:MAG: cyclic nucleotide-binding domain-containing protein [Mariprofundaceae bacterium]
MTKLCELEEKIVQALKTAKANNLEHRDAISLQKKALKFAQKGKHEKAAAAYGALATIIQDNLDLPMRTARCYQKAYATEDAARWFIQAAERYASHNYPTQAIATLRIYHGLKPDDHQGPKRVYKLCRAQGEPAETILQFLSSKDRAGQKLHANDLFSIFDDHIFDALLNKMKFRQLADKELLVQMGDVADSLFFVVRGALDGYLTFNNRRTHLGTVREGGVCGETSYFTGGRRTTEVIARERVELLELPYATLDALKQNSPALNHHLENLYKTRMLAKQLALTPLFEEMSAELRQNIATKMEQINIGAGQTLFMEGDPSLDLYLVRTGKIAINILINGSERLLKTVETGGIAGEVAIAANGKRTATVRTVSDCTLMKLGGVDYSGFYQQHPSLQQLVHERKQAHVVEALEMVKGINMVEGDDTCELLLKDIWQA